MMFVYIYILSSFLILVGLIFTLMTFKLKSKIKTYLEWKDQRINTALEQIRSGNLERILAGLDTIWALGDYNQISALDNLMRSPWGNHENIEMKLRLTSAKLKINAPFQQS